MLKNVELSRMCNTYTACVHRNIVFWKFYRKITCTSGLNKIYFKNWIFKTDIYGVLGLKKYTGSNGILHHYWVGYFMLYENIEKVWWILFSIFIWFKVDWIPISGILNFEQNIYYA